MEPAGGPINRALRCGAAFAGKMIFWWAKGHSWRRSSGRLQSATSIGLPSISPSSISPPSIGKPALVSRCLQVVGDEGAHQLDQALVRREAQAMRADRRERRGPGADD